MNKITLLVFATIFQTQYVFASINLLPYYSLQTGSVDVNLDNVFVLYEAAKLGNAHQLLESCLSFIDNNLQEVTKLDQFLKLAIQDVNMILSRQTLIAKEIDKFNGLAKWIKAN